MPDSYRKLRHQCLLESTRQFNARGKSVVRCDLCQLAAYACICPWRPTRESRSEFLLLMHRDEVFKPTNTGRLIADVFPDKTHVFAWSRTDPVTGLLELLHDETRQCFLIYPADSDSDRVVQTVIPPSGKTTTFILLDGTWKQSGRMFHLSRWLDAIPVLALPETMIRTYAVRKSHQENYLSTVEAAGLCLEMAGEIQQSQVLFDYFALFNLHYLATRGCYTPEVGEIHRRLADMTSAGS